MTVRFYVVPPVGSGVSPNDAWRPKYIADWYVNHGGTRLNAVWQDYASELTFLVAVDVNGAQNTEISGNADVITIPANLDSQVGAALETVQSKLEALNIPTDWVQSTNTYRDVLRVVLKVFKFVCRFEAGQAKKFFDSGVTLDTQINQLTTAQRNALNDAAQSFGLDTSAITGTMPLRQALRLIVVQLPARTFMGEVF